MPSIDCPTCDGSGYVQEEDGETIICSRCEGSGVVFVDDAAGEVMDDVRS